MPDDLGAATPLARREAVGASPPLFASPALDRLTRVHPLVPLVLFGPAIGVLAALALRALPVPDAVAGVACGYLFWTFFEYWVHRVAFHYEPEDGIGARVHWLVHGVHHEHPADGRRLVLPPVVSVPFAAAFLGLFVLVLGTSWAWAFGGGFASGYLLYDMLHFALHHRRPRSRVGRRLHEIHMRHHFDDDTRGYGVSAPWWDIVFGTATRRRGEGRRPRRGDG